MEPRETIIEMLLNATTLVITYTWIKHLKGKCIKNKIQICAP